MRSVNAVGNPVPEESATTARPIANPEYTGHNMVFIVGAPRSGTTWLQRLLATHPRIRTGQESKLFRWYIAPQLRMWAMETTRERNRETANGRGGTGLLLLFPGGGVCLGSEALPLVADAADDWSTQER